MSSTSTLNFEEVLNKARDFALRQKMAQGFSLPPLQQSVAAQVSGLPALNSSEPVALPAPATGGNTAPSGFNWEGAMQNARMIGNTNPNPRFDDLKARIDEMKRKRGELVEQRPTAPAMKTFDQMDPAVQEALRQRLAAMGLPEPPRMIAPPQRRGLSTGDKWAMGLSALFGVLGAAKGNPGALAASGGFMRGFQGARDQEYADQQQMFQQMNAQERQAYNDRMQQAQFRLGMLNDMEGETRQQNQDAMQRYRFDLDQWNDQDNQLFKEIGSLEDQMRKQTPTPAAAMEEKRQVWAMLRDSDAETQQGMIDAMVQSGDWERMFGQDAPPVGTDGRYQVHFADAPPVKAPVDKETERQKLRHAALQDEVAQLLRSFNDPHTTPQARQRISSRLAEIKKYAPEVAQGYVPRPGDRMDMTPAEQRAAADRAAARRISEGHLALSRERLTLQKAGKGSGSTEAKALASKVKTQADWLKRVYMVNATSPEMRANAQAAMVQMEKEFPGSIGFVPTDGGWGPGGRPSTATKPVGSLATPKAQSVPVPKVTLPKPAKPVPGKYGSIIKIERVKN